MKGSIDIPITIIASVLVILTIIVSMNFFKKNTEIFCSNQFKEEIDPIIRRACEMTDSDKKEESKIYMKDCINKVTFDKNEGKLKYQLKSGDKYYSLDTKCTSTSGVVSIVEFDFNNVGGSLDSSKRLEYKIIISNKLVYTPACQEENCKDCCSDCSCDKKGTCDACKDDKDKQCVFLNNFNECYQIKKIPCNEGGSFLECIEAADILCNNKVIYVGCRNTECIYGCGDCNSINYENLDYIKCINIKCQGFDKSKCCEKIKSCSDYTTYYTCLINECYKTTGDCIWEYNQQNGGSCKSVQ